MHNRRPHAAASRGGSNAATMRHQQQQQQQQQHQHQRQHITAGGNNGALSGGNEGIVQKLQGVIAAIRGDRNREHRNRDIAMEKLRSTKEAFHQDKATLQADKDKYIATQNELENTQNEILNIVKSMQELQQTVRIYWYSRKLEVRTIAQILLVPRISFFLLFAQSFSSFFCV
jgi:hypothetical protein